MPTVYAEAINTAIDPPPLLIGVFLTDFEVEIEEFIAFLSNIVD
jgi:hypothetical protein